MRWATGIGLALTAALATGASASANATVSLGSYRISFDGDGRTVVARPGQAVRVIVRRAGRGTLHVRLMSTTREVRRHSTRRPGTLRLTLPRAVPASYELTARVGRRTVRRTVTVGAFGSDACWRAGPALASLELPATGIQGQVLDATLRNLGPTCFSTLPAVRFRALQSDGTYQEVFGGPPQLSTLFSIPGGASPLKASLAPSFSPGTYIAFLMLTSASGQAAEVTAPIKIVAPGG